MTDQPTTRDQLIEQAAQLLADLHVNYSSSGEDEARALADAGLLADPEQGAELADLREQAANAFADTAKLHGMYAKGGTMHLEIEPPHELVLAWVGAARKMLDGAPNYCETRIDAPKVEMEIKVAGEIDRYAFTIQRVGKVTPHEARRNAEAERDALAAKLAATIAKCDEILVSSQNEFERAVAFVVRGVLQDGQPDTSDVTPT